MARSSWKWRSRASLWTQLCCETVTSGNSCSTVLDLPQYVTSLGKDQPFRFYKLLVCDGNSCIRRSAEWELLNGGIIPTKPIYESHEPSSVELRNEGAFPVSLCRSECGYSA